MRKTAPHTVKYIPCVLTCLRGELGSAGQFASAVIAQDFRQCEYIDFAPVVFSNVPYNIAEIEFASRKQQRGAEGEARAEEHMSAEDIIVLGTVALVVLILCVAHKREANTRSDHTNGQTRHRRRATFFFSAADYRGSTSFTGVFVQAAVNVSTPISGLKHRADCPKPLFMNPEDATVVDRPSGLLEKGDIDGAIKLILTAKPK